MTNRGRRRTDCLKLHVEELTRLPAGVVAVGGVESERRQDEVGEDDETQCSALQLLREPACSWA